MQCIDIIFEYYIQSHTFISTTDLIRNHFLSYSVKSQNATVINPLLQGEFTFFHNPKPLSSNLMHIADFAFQDYYTLFFIFVQDM